MKNIKKIVIQVGDVELSLSVEDAKTLYKELSELFEKQPKVTVSYPYPVPVPYQVYQRPLTIWDNPIAYSTPLSSKSSAGLPDNAVRTLSALANSTMKRIS